MGNEWRKGKKWNPYNSAKLLAHVDRWSKIIENDPVPPPVTVTIDPTNACNLQCEWCNAAVLRSANYIDTELLKLLAAFLGKWGVKAVCIAGGGEPTLHPGLGVLIQALHANHVRVGVVTNGVEINKFTVALTGVDWVGVSIDAGTPDVYKSLKGADKFYRVIGNCANLIAVAGEDTNLGRPGLGSGVTYKYLAAPGNIGDIVTATQIAKKAGFKAIHIRPAGAPWFDEGSFEGFSQSDVHYFNEQIAHALNYDDDDFSVYAVQHKFNGRLEKMHNFNKCWAVFMTAVFMPSGLGPNAMDVGVCCDRRGDSATTLTTGLQNPYDLRDGLWGSKEHWDIANEINPCEDCPRCTYAPHNEIMEQVVVKDNMTHDFI